MKKYQLIYSAFVLFLCACHANQKNMEAKNVESGAIEYSHDIEIDTSIVSIHGIVTNTSLLPLEDVVVTMDNYRSTSDMNGTFYFKNIHPGYYSAKVIKNGYCIIEKDSLYFNSGAIIDMKIHMKEK